MESAELGTLTSNESVNAAWKSRFEEVHVNTISMAQPFRLIYRMTTYLIPEKDLQFGMIRTPTLLDVAAILGLHPHGDTLRPFYYPLYLTRSFQVGIEKHPAPDQTRKRLRRKPKRKVLPN